jgi:hypothetical protein
MSAGITGFVKITRISSIGAATGAVYSMTVAPTRNLATNFFIHFYFIEI